jgi:3-methyladenine DNA glycosylase AlkD
MATSKKNTPDRRKSTRARKPAVNGKAPTVDAVIARLERMATRSTRDGMARYGLPSDNALGVPVGKMKQYAKEIGRSHELAAALWKAGWYETRMMAAFIDEPRRVTAAQMDRWCKDFDNWGIVDTVCFSLFDSSPHAFDKVDEWSERRDEFGKRAAFALLACLALHGRGDDDEWYARRLALIERAASDDRNFVKKGVLWALRGVGGRSRELHAAAVATAGRLAKSEQSSARWIGKTALRELAKAKERASWQR